MTTGSTRRLALGLLAAALVVGLGGCARARATVEPTVKPTPAPASTTAVPEGTTGATLPIRSYVRVPPSAPLRVRIPRIGVSSPLVELGLAADGSMQVPAGADYDKAGWFTEGPEPGQLGPAVIAGHVDSKAGPSVFFRLRDVHAGDHVLVDREDGRTLRFVVESSHQYPKAELPTNDVFGPLPWPALRLITCGGAFDRSSRSYTDNIVVTARLAGA